MRCSEVSKALLYTEENIALYSPANAVYDNDCGESDDSLRILVRCRQWLKCIPSSCKRVVLVFHVICHFETVPLSAPTSLILCHCRLRFRYGGNKGQNCSRCASCKRMKGSGLTTKPLRLWLHITTHRPRSRNRCRAMCNVLVSYSARAFKRNA